MIRSCISAISSVVALLAVFTAGASEPLRIATIQPLSGPFALRARKS